jgi:NADPH-dependent ferric siderophore reductase
MTLAAPPVPAYRPFVAEVARVQRLSPSFLRVTFTGPSFDDLAPNGWDQRIKVLLPTADRGLRDCPRGDDWYAEWRALPEERRNPMRSYTVRAARPDVREVDVDFVLHGATGPASSWAEQATGGDEVVLIGPNARFPGPTGGFEWHPPADAALLLLAGDETAVPALCAIVESLPAGTRARVLMEVPETGDVLPLAVPVGVEVTWLPRRPTNAPRGLPLTAHVLEAVRDFAAAAVAVPAPQPEEDSAVLPWDVPAEPLGSGLYTWLAGEAGMVTGLRRELVQGLGVDRRSVAFMGYWRAGRSGS